MPVVDMAKEDLVNLLRSQPEETDNAQVLKSKALLATTSTS